MGVLRERRQGFCGGECALGSARCCCQLPHRAGTGRQIKMCAYPFIPATPALANSIGRTNCTCRIAASGFAQDYMSCRHWASSSLLTRPAQTSRPVPSLHQLRFPLHLPPPVLPCSSCCLSYFQRRSNLTVSAAGNSQLLTAFRLPLGQCPRLQA